LELNVLVSIEDVTDRVNAKVTKEMSEADAGKARRSAGIEIEKDAFDKTGLRADVVTLYQGGRYALYTYKKYTDVRLVFAPEFDIAFFGGDPDNFEYPRYDLDVCFFRAYENGQPAKPKHYLKWSANGSQEGELVFVSGHPGRTSRLFTHEALEYARDVQMPFTMEMLRNREEFLTKYAALGEEQARQSKDTLFSVQNSRKARLGGLRGLRNESFMARKKADDAALRDRAKLDSQNGPHARIAAAMTKAPGIALDYNTLERALAFDSELFTIARSLVRLADENGKPNAERLREYGDAGRASLEQQLFSDAPIFPEFEAAKLANSLSFWDTVYRSRHRIPPALYEKVLAGRTPEAAAKELISGSKLSDVAVRKQLAEGGTAAIEASRDPMILLAKLIDADARAARKQFEDEIEGVLTPAYAEIAKARFAAHGDNTYPDATFTLRLAFGTVKGYEQDGETVAPFTTVGGAFEHETAHGAKPPWVLPPSWHEAKKDGRLRLDTPLNFVSTVDIIGGNSGSPVVNRGGEVVGLIFDGNIQSLVWDFGYDDSQARSVSVDSRAISHTLRAVYRAETLLGELTGRRLAPVAAER
jgi:hypothetical protein